MTAASSSLEDYRVELDYYSGPLDLLLHLVKKHEIDLHDIPIARLTEQYLEHLEHVKTLDINLASEFLVMAATLLEIKSQMIAPRPADEADADATDAISEIDPRYELVQQLLEYKRFKDAANALEERHEHWQSRFAHKPAHLRDDDKAGGAEASDEDDEAAAEALELDLEDVGVNDLCDAFARILESIGQGKAVHAIVYDDTPIALHAEDIVDRLERDGPMTLADVFVGRQSRSEMIGLFLAMLELVRQRRLRIKQDRPGATIRLELRPADDAAAPAAETDADWRDPQTGEIQYEWPSEQARQRAERRAKRRAERLSKREFGKPDEDDLDDVVIIDDHEEGDEDKEDGDGHEDGGGGDVQAKDGPGLMP